MRERERGEETERGEREEKRQVVSVRIPRQPPKEDAEEFSAVEAWLRSYNVQELVNEKGEILPEVRNAYAKGTRRLGMNPVLYKSPKKLVLPDIYDFAQKPTFTFESPSAPSSGKDKEGEGEEKDVIDLGFGVRARVTGKAVSITKIAGQWFKELMRRNPTSFRIFSPDELESNKLGAVLELSSRAFQWYEDEFNKGGRIIEVLSEHILQGLMQGYAITGRYGLFPSYESFLGIITTMMQQWSKFIKILDETRFRAIPPSINYIESSTLWRQEHNGYSHQNPMFINNMINMKGKEVSVYLPPDANCMLCVLEKTMNTQGHVNLIVSSKAELPVLLSMEEAYVHVTAGVSIWKKCSTEGGLDPDVVLVGCGNETTMEVLAAAYLLRKDSPHLRIRVVNVVDLLVLDIDSAFDSIFTPDKPVVFNFHGYPSVINQLLFGRTRTSRIKVLGYIEEGTTTTPFNMLSVNRASRFHVAIEALSALQSRALSRISLDANLLIAKYKALIEDHAQFITRYGKDPDWVEEVYSLPPKFQLLERMKTVEEEEASIKKSDARETMREKRQVPQPREQQGMVAP